MSSWLGRILPWVGQNLALTDRVFLKSLTQRLKPKDYSRSKTNHWNHTIAMPLTAGTAIRIDLHSAEVVHFTHTVQPCCIRRNEDPHHYANYQQPPMGLDYQGPNTVHSIERVGTLPEINRHEFPHSSCRDRPRISHTVTESAPSAPCALPPSELWL